ncbi:hypothetical protein CCMA1212_001651 [Trichoderma ghanense]|uniref:Uncharacterized protein n=1 Tax=Trichoderma ghanense TaxID=65468 RepID=A0ABY2HDE5_9HYPO
MQEHEPMRPLEPVYAGTGHSFSGLIPPWNMAGIQGHPPASCWTTGSCHITLASNGCRSPPESKGSGGIEYLTWAAGCIRSQATGHLCMHAASPSTPRLSPSQIEPKQTKPTSESLSTHAQQPENLVSSSPCRSQHSSRDAAAAMQAPPQIRAPEPIA